MKKLIAVAVAAVLLVGIWSVDYARSKAYEFEMAEISSDTFVADGYSLVKLTIKLSKDGKPVEGHTVKVVASNGTLPANSGVTDHDGLITFRYYPYLYLNDKLTPLQDVTFRFEDESNSTIFMVPASAEFTYKVVKPEEETVWKDWQEIVLEEETENE